MPRAEKEQIVADLADRIENADGTILTEFRGLKVTELKELRLALSDSGTEFRIIKNSLGRLAFKKADQEGMLDFLEGSTAVAFIDGDPVEAAKGLDDFASKYPALVLKGGFVEGEIIDGDRLGDLAKIEPREVLLSQFAGMLKQPLTKFVTVLGAPLRDLGYLLAGYQGKLETEGPDTEDGSAKAEDPSSEEAPTASAEGAEDEAPGETASADDLSSENAQTPDQESSSETQDSAGDGEENKEE